jgi:sugar phosphate isomerase/epimerase
MKVGIDSYCYHRYFGEVYDFQKDPGTRWTTADFVKSAIALKVDGVSLELCFFSSFDRDHLKRLREMLDQAGLERVAAWGHPDGLQAGGNPAALKDLIQHIETAKALGADVMRVVGSSLMFRDQPHGPQLERLTAMFKEAVKVAEDKNITLAMENHIDYTAREILELIQKVDSKYFGVNFDTGNCLRMFEDPVASAELLAPYIYATHIKDLSPRKGGSPCTWNWWESVPVGFGIVDIPAVLKVLKNAGYLSPLCVEVDCLRADWEEAQAVAMSVNYLREQVVKLG